MEGRAIRELCLDKHDTCMIALVLMRDWPVCIQLTISKFRVTKASFQFTIDSYTDDLAGFFTRHNIRFAVLVAHSMGSLAAPQPSSFKIPVSSRN